MPATEGVSTDDVQPSMADGGEAGEAAPVSRAPPASASSGSQLTRVQPSLTLSGVALGS